MIPLFEQEMTVIEQTKLQQYEAVIEHGLQTFVDVGNALLAIRDEHLYRPHQTFEEYCQERWHMTRGYANELIRAANVVKNLDGIPSNTLPQTPHQVRPLATLAPEDQRAAWQEAVETAPDGRITGAHVASVVERYKQPGPPAEDEDGEVELTDLSVTVYCPECHVVRSEWYKAVLGSDVTYRCGVCESEFTPGEWEDLQQEDDEADATGIANVVMPNRAYKNSSESNEWYTPRTLIEKAIEVMGAIDLDPASSEKANKTVAASKIYTIEDNALVQSWKGRVWLNPPYGNDVEPFVAKLIESVESGDVSEALLLVAARTDTAWFRRLRRYPRCFIWGRIKFINGDTGEPGDPAGFPSMVVYMGPKFLAFVDEFKSIGDVYTWWRE